MEDFVGNKFDTFYFNQGFFKPRAREGCDVIQTGLPPAYKISIHAPARGATAQIISLLPEFLFQSTHPRGVRRYGRKSNFFFRNFNPRTREGCDDIRFLDTAQIKISIHAPARGATLISSCISFSLQISIHAPAMGATTFLFQ